MFYFLGPNVILGRTFFSANLLLGAYCIPFIHDAPWDGNFLSTGGGNELVHPSLRLGFDGPRSKPVKEDIKKKLDARTSRQDRQYNPPPCGASPTFGSLPENGTAAIGVQSGRDDNDGFMDADCVDDNQVSYPHPTYPNEVGNPECIYVYIIS